MSAEQIKKRLFRSYIRPEYFYIPVKEKETTIKLTIEQWLWTVYDVKLKNFKSTTRTAWCTWQLLDSDRKVVATGTAATHTLTVFANKYYLKIVKTDIYNPFKEFRDEIEVDCTDKTEPVTLELFGYMSVFKFRYRIEEVENIYNYNDLYGYNDAHIKINNASDKSINVIADMYIDDILICSSTMIGGFNNFAATFTTLYYTDIPIYFDRTTYGTDYEEETTIVDFDSNSGFCYIISYRDAIQGTSPSVYVTKENYHNKINELKENPNITIISATPCFRVHIKRANKYGVINDNYTNYNYRYGSGSGQGGFGGFLSTYYEDLKIHDCLDLYYDPNIYNRVSYLNGCRRIFNLEYNQPGYGWQKQFHMQAAMDRYNTDSSELTANLEKNGYNVLGYDYYKFGDVYINDLVDNIMRQDKSTLSYITNLNIINNTVINNDTNPISTDPRIILENGDVEDLVFGGFKWQSPDYIE